MGCWLFRGETLMFKESVERPALFCVDCLAGDGLRNGLEQMMCFNCGWKESFRQFYGKMRRIFEQDEVVEIFE